MNLNYPELIQTQFKENYLQSLGKKEDFDFQSLLEKTLESLDVMSTPQELKEKLKVWYKNIHELAYLEGYFEIPELREIIVHNTNEGQYEAKSKLLSFPLSLSAYDYQLSLEVLALKNHISWNYSQPFASFPVHLNNEIFRATLIHESVTPQKSSKLFLRKLKEKAFPLEHFGLPEETLSFFKKAITEKKNILLAGPTGSGKTSFLKALLAEVSSEEHLVIIEDTHELVSAHPHCSFLLGEDLPHKKLKDHCAYALRMRPDRIIIGEMRSEEVVPFILAMNTGHRGLMSTLHANSAPDALSRLVVLFTLYGENENLSYNLVMKLICQSIDYVVFLEERKVKEVIKVLGSEDGRPYYERLLGDSTKEEFMVH